MEESSTFQKNDVPVFVSRMDKMQYRNAFTIVTLLVLLLVSVFRWDTKISSRSRQIKDHENGGIVSKEILPLSDLPPIYNSNMSHKWHFYFFNHLQRIRSNAKNENWPRFWEWFEVIPHKSKHGKGYSYSADEKAPIHKTMVLHISMIFN